MSEARFPAERGSYLLWMYLARGQEMGIGGLGLHEFRRGWYAYCGSAFGPGGLRARLNHHLKEAQRPHWHIDYLKEAAEIRAVWICRGVNSEHDWSRRLLTLAAAQIPLSGFGSSDCNCRSHLVYLPRRPASRIVQELLRGDCPIGRYNLGRA
ncbi:MAG: GIY-YIG nuclease family protein [Deltaproteobacteria bacterium]|jgi:Uri superfamily endonuclease|nr:GIY-YIG nuclease family protein [Deltaproteobacteria bacterium]MCW8893047.1 GIY-YIG nuclease family protein [Deltaproteobacteria bacterium]MCW9050552.1 GIY-YIG nuclease family protein [Deltaproteobacteria bacterium]